LLLFLYNYFIFILTFPLRRVAGTAALEDSKYLTVNSNLSELCWLHTNTGPNTVGDAVTPPGAWWTSAGPLPCGCSQQELLHQSFLRHSGHVAEQTQMRSHLKEKLLDIQDFINFTSVHFVAKCYIVTSLRKSHLCLLHLG